MNPVQRELNSTVLAIAQRLQIGREDVIALIRAVDTAAQRLCPLWAAWTLYHVVHKRFGDDAAVAAATAALTLSCGRTNKDALIDCAVHLCDACGYSIRTSDADNIASTARDVAGILGLDTNTAGYLSGILKYRFLQTFGAVSIDLHGNGVFAGELLAYAVHMLRSYAI